MAIDTEKLKEIMTARGFTAASLARAAGLNSTAIRDILIGRSKNPRISTVNAIAAQLQSAPDRFLEGAAGHAASQRRSQDIAEISAAFRQMPGFQERFDDNLAYANAAGLGEEGFPSALESTLTDFARDYNAGLLDTCDKGSGERADREWNENESLQEVFTDPYERVKRMGILDLPMLRTSRSDQANAQKTRHRLPLFELSGNWERGRLDRKASAAFPDPGFLDPAAESIAVKSHYVGMEPIYRPGDMLFCSLIPFPGVGDDILALKGRINSLTKDNTTSYDCVLCRTIGRSGAQLRVVHYLYDFEEEMSLDIGQNWTFFRIAGMQHP